MSTKKQTKQESKEDKQSKLIDISKLPADIARRITTYGVKKDGSPARVYVLKDECKGYSVLYKKVYNLLKDHYKTNRRVDNMETLEKVREMLESNLKMQENEVKTIKEEPENDDLSDYL